jgi:folate-binding protein YgfZ
VSASEEAVWFVETVAVYPLADAAIIEVGDDDARAWLQGQLTCDVSTLAAGGSVYGLVVSTKGRVEADVVVVDRGETLLLIVPRAASEGILERFDRFIVMDDVTVRLRDDLLIWTAQGPASAELARDPSWRADRVGGRGLDVAFSTGDEAAITEWIARAEALGGGVASAAGIELAHLRAGIPRYGIDFGPQTYPQESGLAGRALSFAKGCYVGQETVVMIEHRGRPPRRLGHFEGELAERGDAVFGPNDDPAGEVTSAAPDSATGTRILLARIKRGADETPEALTIGGRPLRFRGWVGD